MRTRSRVFTRAAALLSQPCSRWWPWVGTGRAAPVCDKHPGDRAANKVRDNRSGSIAPTSQQRERAAEAGARASWNKFGTPAQLVSTGKPLASGLPAGPVAAAQAYIADNRDVLGLTESGAAALELLAVAPMGEGAAVLFRQRFGDLAAGVDGMLSVGVRDGAVWYVSSSLAPDAAAPGRRRCPPPRPGRSPSATPVAADATVMQTELVAVPTADRRPGGLRGHTRRRRQRRRRLAGGVRHLCRRARRVDPAPREPGRL